MNVCNRANISTLCISRCEVPGCSFLRKEICCLEGGIITAIAPDARKQGASGGVGDLFEFPTQGCGGRFGVMARRLDILVAEEALHVGDVHAEPQQFRRHGVAQQVRIDPLVIPAFPATDFRIAN